MAVSHTLVVATVLGSLLVCVRADLCAPACSGGSAIFPHPQDCSSFYQCSSGTAFLQHCAAGLEFNPIGHYCDYPAQAGCTSDPARECGAADPSEEEAEETPNICAPKCPYAGVYLPHPQDCTKFYICGGSVMPFETSCQPGLHYDMKHRRCDYPENVTCIASPERACDEHLQN